MTNGITQRRLLAFLTLIMICNYVDRVALGLMLPDIKVDLELSDTQLGLLTGIAFAAFYAVMGIPIARWADRGDRVWIISLTTGLWSLAVGAAAAAASFLQLLLIRIGVAIGEAGCHPPALSLIADYFTRDERPRAVARYMLGWPAALLIGFFAGGWLIHFFGWRVTFLVLAAPGLVLALLAPFVLQEPRRGSTDTSLASPSSDDTGNQKPSVQFVVWSLWRNRAYRHLLLAHSISYFFGNGLLQWQPTFFVRTHHVESSELGMWFAAVYGIGGLIGTFAGGEIASRYAAGNERRQLDALAGVYAVLAIVGACVYVPSNLHSAMALLALSSIGAALVVGPMFAATQSLVPPSMRAMSIAIVLFFANLIGLGLGPLAAGALSDALRPAAGEDSLRLALLALCPGYLWCAWHLSRAAKAIEQGDSRMSKAIVSRTASPQESTFG